MMVALSNRRISFIVLSIFFFFFMTALLKAAALLTGPGNARVFMGDSSSPSLTMVRRTNSTLKAPHRKLLHRQRGIDELTRIGGEKCTKADITVFQGLASYLPSGIPAFKVEITNMCVTGCEISGIHVSCGWFSSTCLINPRIFKRLRYDDCLVNDGKPLAHGRTLSFQYANSFSYPLSVSAVAC